METIHLKGFISDNNYNDGVEFAYGYSGNIAKNIESALYEILPTAKDSKLQDDEYSTEASIFVPTVFFRIHISDNEITLEEAENNFVLSSIGALDIYQEWYGYSEWTILGYDVINFKLVGNDGEHDLEQILSNYKGKYVHILIDVIE